MSFVCALTDDHDGYAVENLSFDTIKGTPVCGLLTRPANIVSPAPAILYLHAHGKRYDIGARELIDGRPALMSPLGPIFASMGFVSLCLDLPCFGQRSNMSESAASKALLWYGRTLVGQMLGEQSSALSYLANRADVDPNRIGAFGISMGATLAYWLAAIDQRITALAHLCCYADFAILIKTGVHDLHGPYLSVPGLLNFATNGLIAGLIAPRAQLIAIGDKDPLTPPEAVDCALAETRAAYKGCNALEALEIVREPDSAHCETPAMRQKMLAFFAAHLC